MRLQSLSGIAAVKAARERLSLRCIGWHIRPARGGNVTEALWAAAVSGFVKGEDGLALFVRAIPYNFYAILTIVMMVAMVLLKVEFGSMAKHEKNAMNGDLFSMGDRTQNIQEDEKGSEKGKVIDLIIPIVCLVICWSRKCL